jgi:hypothetical protein
MRSLSTIPLARSPSLNAALLRPAQATRSVTCAVLATFAELLCRTGKRHPTQTRAGAVKGFPHLSAANDLHESRDVGEPLEA